MPKNCIVTGASRGIGRATAESLAREGHSVLAVARSGQPLRELQESHAGHIVACPADLTAADDIQRIRDEVSERFGTLDILINNAGGLINKPFEELTAGDWKKLVDINLLSAVSLVRTLLPYLAEGAHIVNISSMGGFQGSTKFPGLSAYSVTKGALSIFSECLAAELAGRNIKSNALCLGAVQTEMLQEAFPGIDTPVTPGQMGTYIADFACNGSTFYNGQILPVALSDPG